MSIRGEPKSNAETPATVLSEAANTDTALAEGNSFSVASPDNPLERTVLVSVRASLNDLCLQKAKGTWAPSTEALRSIFQQKRFTSLDGAAESMGDLKSIVLHSMAAKHVKSTFPITLGAKITGVGARWLPSPRIASLVLTPPVRSQTTQHFRQPARRSRPSFFPTPSRRRRRSCRRTMSVSRMNSARSSRATRQSAHGVPRCAACRLARSPSPLRSQQPRRERHPRGLAAALCARLGRPSDRVSGALAMSVQHVDCKTC